MLKLALSGKMLSGKTTVAEYLARSCGAHPVSLAGQLKAKLVLAGVDPHDVYVKKPPLVRELMQIYGQVIRAQDEDYWVNCALSEVATLEEVNADIAVIDDLRFRNEALRLREEGFLLVRLERVGARDTGRTAYDISEVDLDDWEDWDLVISADDGDVFTLFSEIDNFINMNS